MPTKIMTRLLAGTALSALLTGAAFAADANARPYDIPQQDAATALQAYAMQSGKQVLFPYEAVKGKQAPQIKGDYSDAEVLALLAGSAGLKVTADDGKTVTLRPQAAAAPEGGDEGTVQALVVTAQKREENIQDVPIAMSAFSQEDLTRSQVAGGPDLITQVPNMTFTKTNFTSYSIQLRGIGTQAISATVDPAVAVAFNNTPFIKNRFFEQEFYDLQRVEVLRGPQGTLYGRNATAGVVNLISAKPKFTYEAKVSADVANYSSSRLEGMVNVPLVEDKVALRLAGAWTKREGYAVNELNGNPIDGRDLWSTRLSLRFAPTDRLDANLIWEHFEEDDDRIRSGKQLCKSDIITEIGGFPVGFYDTWPASVNNPYVQSQFSQGCVGASLYSPDSFQKPNALSLPFYVPLGAVGLPIRTDDGTSFGNPLDPYISRTQSSDLRVIEAAVDPSYRAKTDIAELQVSFDLTDALTLSSETAWGSDFVFSTQDYNRFAGTPNLWRVEDGAKLWLTRGLLSPDGEFCDPQIGCSDTLVAMDLSTARSRQFSQELRLASDFDGRFNFSIGGNFLRYDTEDKYYVFINSLTMVAAASQRAINAPEQNIPWIVGATDNRNCLPYGMIDPNYSQLNPIITCVYIDPNSVDNLNDRGHNYFLSKNPFKLISYAAFGEAYYQLADNLKVTAGLRWTVDKKEAPFIPSWVFAAQTVGYPVVEVVRQEWREPTGRLAVDWKPDLSFTDQTMVYASYSHGYKAGGMNPPSYGRTRYGVTLLSAPTDLSEALARASTLHPKTFDPEFIDAFEIGSKNTLLNGALTLNLAGFYYDYKGYQLSQIVDRSAVTHNFDADVWGLELESDWRPAENLRLGLKLGYEKTKVADGMQAIDVMDRTAGDDAWMVVRPFATFPNNCVLPTWLILGHSGFSGHSNPEPVTIGNTGGGGDSGCELAYLLNLDPVTFQSYRFDPFATNPAFSGLRKGINYAAWSTRAEDYPCLPPEVDAATIGTRDYPGVDPACLIAASHNGEGFFKDLSGNELPNAPNLTATVTADYTVPLPSDWLMTLHTDLYYQSEAWTRIFNTPGYDKLKAYTNVNLAAIFTNDDAGWKVMAYVKNVFDRDSITGAFLNSDDTGLTTNVFLTEPRLYGLRVTKEWNGGPWWTGANLDHSGPFPLTVELSGQVQRQDRVNGEVNPTFVQTLQPDADPTAGLHNRDLDWGDGRSVRLTYRPEGTSWSISAGFRYGRTNNDRDFGHASANRTETICGAQDPLFVNLACDPTSPLYDDPFALTLRTANFREWADASVVDAEKHTIIDFEVGLDVGIGGLSDSTVRGGLRKVDFNSRTTVFGQAQADWNIPDGWIYVSSSYNRHESNLLAEREFDGAGPELAWDAAVALLGNDANGQLKANWSLGGGLLFGKQRTSTSGAEEITPYAGLLAPNNPPAFSAAGSTSVTHISVSRDSSEQVPFADLSLGLSYDVGRVQVGAGYRWERYFDVLDVGYHESKQADRTIDGPYFKIAVGFGG